MGVLIRNGTILTALDEWIGDIYCDEGKIEAIGPDLEGGGADQVIDASGQFVFPGGLVAAARCVRESRTRMRG